MTSLHGKLCRSCDTFKAATEFNRRNDRPNGLQSKCKPCQRQAVKANSQSQAAKIRAAALQRDRRRRNKPLLAEIRLGNGYLKMPDLTDAEIKRFWATTSPAGGPKGCMEWLGGVSSNGYGRFAAKDRRIQAHRVAYFLSHNADPLEMEVCHHCDNPPCVNPSHLFLGTHETNAHDMIAKGRAAHRDRHPQSKLTLEQVRQIRQIGRTVTQKALATRFGVDRATISYILNNRIWVGV